MASGEPGRRLVDKSPVGTRIELASGNDHLPHRAHGALDALLQSAPSLLPMLSVSAPPEPASARVGSLLQAARTVTSWPT